MAKIAQTTSNEVPTQNVDNSEILALVKEQAKLIADLQAKVSPENTFKKAKERYEGPRNYSYKLWGEVPVLSYKSVKKDLTKDFRYKDHLGVSKNNQDLELTLADDTKLTVDSIEFGLNFTRSEKIPAEPITDGVSVTGYQFDIADYGKFIVHHSLIN